MTNLPSRPGIEPRFNDFLFASVGEDRSGMPLSLLSALARLDLDPWAEAARLAALPGEAAIEQLSALISPHAAGFEAPLDPAAIAARLIALLPPQSSRGTSSPALGTVLGAFDRWWPIAYVGFVAISLSVAILVGTRQTNAKPETAHAQAIGSVSETAEPLNLSRRR